MRILNSNKLGLGMLTYSSQLEKYPFSEAFTDNALSRWGKFSGNTNQYLQVTYSAATSIYYVYLLNTNIGSAGTVTLQCSNDGFSTISASFNLTRYGTSWIYRNDSGISFKSYRIVCTDSTVTYIRLSKLYLGGYVQMPRMSEITKPIKSNARFDKTDSGQLYGYSVCRLKSYTIGFDTVNQPIYKAINEWFSTFDKVKPVLCLLHEDSLADELPLYCNIADDLEWKTAIVSGIQYQLQMKLEECK